MFKFNYQNDSYRFSLYNDNELEIIATCNMSNDKNEVINANFKNISQKTVDDLENKINFLIKNIYLVFENFETKLVNLKLNDTLEFNENKIKIDCLNKVKINKKLTTQNVEHILNNFINDKDALIIYEEKEYIYKDFLYFVNSFLNSFDKISNTEKAYKITAISRYYEAGIFGIAFITIIEGEESVFRFEFSNGGFLFSKKIKDNFEFIFKDTLDNEAFFDNVFKDEINSRRIKNTLNPKLYHFNKNKHRLAGIEDFRDEIINFYKDNYSPREIENIFATAFDENKHYYNNKKVSSGKSVSICLMDEDLFIYSISKGSKKFKHFKSKDKEKAVEYHKKEIIKFVEQEEEKLLNKINSKVK